MTNPFIIMSAPNGARRQKIDHPEIPITPAEMAICAKQILESGASILHLHVRDDDNRHSLDVDRYRASITAIRDAVGHKLIIQATTEAVGIYDRDQQMQMVRELKPEATSIALRELCPKEQNVTNFSHFMKWMSKERIFPQIILYSREDYLRFKAFRARGIFHHDNPFILFVFGSYQGQTVETVAATAKLKDNSLAADIPWAVCGFADNEKDCTIHAVQNGGHARVGFENNIWKDSETLLENNAEMVRFAAEMAKNEQRPVANAQDVRNLFNLKD